MPDVEDSWILGPVLLHLAVKGSQGLTTAARFRTENGVSNIHSYTGSHSNNNNNGSNSNNNNGSNSNNNNGSHSNNNNVCLRAWDS